jgi:hypothetical protein
MRRIGLLLLLLLLVGRGWSQTSGYIPFSPSSDARKTIEELENRPEIIDSLRRVYDQRWTIGMSFGQRFVSKDNRTSIPDTITFADFSSKSAFFGLEGGYFLSSRFQITAAVDVLLLPKLQQINNVVIGSNGIQADGYGSGGAMINFGVGGKYHFHLSPYSRLYSGVKLGRIKAVVEGGTGGFSQSQGRFQETKRFSSNYAYLNGTFGITHRFTPGFMIDFNLGYLMATNSQNIGGMLSPGGITSTLSLQFFIGKGNKAP